MKKVGLFLMSVVLVLSISSFSNLTFKVVLGNISFDNQLNTIYAADASDIGVIYGWASVNYLGQNGTTGGEGGQIIDVYDKDTLEDVLYQDDQAAIVVIHGNLTGGPDMVNVKGNKTIVGADDGASLDFGLYLRGNNIIIRNLDIMNGGYEEEDTEGDDAVSFASDIHHVWIDHCTLHECADGTADPTRNARFVTISYCHFYRQKTAVLIGDSSDDSAAEEAQDNEDKREWHYTVTMHHNWFEGVDERTPRVRFGAVHMYNNYIQDNSTYAVGIGAGANVYSENNYFLNTTKVWQPWDEEYGVNNGYVDDIGSVFEGNNGDITDEPPTGHWIWSPANYYNYELYSAEWVKENIPNNVGVGTIGLLDGSEGDDGDNTDTNNAPIVNISSPAYNAPYTQDDLLTAVAEVSDTDGSINSVDWYIDGSLYTSLYTQPWSINVALSIYSTGIHSIYAVAEDNEGAISRSTAVNFVIEADSDAGSNENQDGPLTLEAENGSFNGGTINGDYLELDGNRGSYIEWTFNMSQAEEADAVWYYNTSNKVKFYVTVNGVDTGGIKSLEPGSTETSRGIDFPAGDITLRMEVKEDADGPINIDKVVIESQYATGSDSDDTGDDNDSNQAPSISVTIPATGDSFPENAVMQTEAYGSDADGNIVSVHWYIDGIYTTSTTSSPWSSSINLSRYNTGTHSIYAVAEDNDGASTQSSTVSFEIAEDQTGEIATLQIQENEAGFVEVDGNIESEHSGYTGDGYANTVNESSSYIEWSVNTPSTGSYELQWRFANGGSSNRTARVIVNGTTQVSGVAFEVTGSWDSWLTTSMVYVSLQAGTNTIRLAAETGDGLSNVDWIEITGNSPSAGDGSNDDGDDSGDNGDDGSDEPIEGDIILGPNDAITLQESIEGVQAGNTIYLESGTYTFSQSVIIEEGNDGNLSAMKRIFAYNGATPVIDFSPMAENSSNRGVVLAGSYWYFKGIIIQNAGDNGMLLAGDNNIIEDCTFRYNRDSGLQLSRYDSDYDDISQWPSNNLILNCESHDNSDSDHEDADGFAPKLTCGEGNVFQGCVSHHNIDDGWDMYAKSETGPIGVVTLIGCIAHNNGVLSDGSTSGNGDKNGFKLGSSGIYVDHIVRRCIAFNNGKHGFTDNGNTSSIEFTNNTSYNNTEYNFHVRDGASHIFKNNVSFAGGHTDRIVGDVSAPNALTEDEIDWPYTADASDFIILTPGPDSDPTSNGFLSLASDSELIDAGVVSEGIDYSGSAPDLGAVESGFIY